MKIYISADIEGIWGVVSAGQTSSKGNDYQRARKLMTEEVNLAIEAALESGATEVVVNDSHGSMDNIIIEELHEKARLISGRPKALSMMEGIDDTFDGVMFIGYHPRAGTDKGILDHTYAGGIISQVLLNGTLLGECGLNARIAGYYDVPTIFIAGDTKVTKQAVQEIGNIEALAVKDALSRFCSNNLSKDELKKGYKEKVSKAIKNIKDYKVVKAEPEIELEIEFHEAVMADMCMLVPNVKRESNKVVSYKSKDYIEAYKLFRALIALAISSLPKR